MMYCLNTVKYVRFIGYPADLINAEQKENVRLYLLSDSLCQIFTSLRFACSSRPLGGTSQVQQESTHQSPVNKDKSHSVR